MTGVDMGTISYDPIKDRFADFIRSSRLLRRGFYFLLDLFFLRSWHIRRLLKKHCTPLDKRGGWTLLDAGCGFGQYDRFVLEQFTHVRVVSVDVKEEYLRDCEAYFKKDIRTGRIHFEKADLLDLNMDTRFDFILCIDVLEHIEDDQAVIHNLTGLLKKGGKLLMHSPSIYAADDASDDDSFVGEHARTGYSISDIRRKFLDESLDIEASRYTYGIFGHFAWVLSIKYPMLLLNRVGMAGLLLLVIYYPLIMPFCLLLNLADLYSRNEKGNGVYMMGSKG